MQFHDSYVLPYVPVLLYKQEIMIFKYLLVIIKTAVQISSNSAVWILIKKTVRMKQSESQERIL